MPGHVNRHTRGTLMGPSCPVGVLCTVWEPSQSVPFSDCAAEILGISRERSISVRKQQTFSLYSSRRCPLVNYFKHTFSEFSKMHSGPCDLSPLSDYWLRDRFSPTVGFLSAEKIEVQVWSTVYKLG